MSLTYPKYKLNVSSSINRVLSTKLDESYSVKDFGALGDGTTDDTSSIQNAINQLSTNGGGVLFFPYGTYILNSTGVILKSNVDMIGLGATISYISPTIAFAKFFTSNGSPISNVEISGFTFDGKGTWSSTAFANPYGSGNSVGFNNSQMGIGIWGTSSSNILVQNNIFKGFGRGLYVANGNGIQIISNIFSNNGQAAIDCEDSTRIIISQNTVTGVLGNITSIGDTNIANSKFGDPIYLYRINGASISNNELENFCRIGVVLEGDAITKNSGVVISNNVIRNANSCRGTEYNAAIWSEGSKSDYTCSAIGNVCDNTGATNGTLGAIGIQGTYLTISGNIIRGYNNIGINGFEMRVFNNTLENNVQGIVLGSQIAGKSTEIYGNRIAYCSLQGIEIYQSHGAINIKNNTFEDNGQTATLNRRSAIMINRYYTNQYLSIANNTFISSANQSATVGQLYSVIGINGGDFTHSSKILFNNQFFFTGTFTSSYPVTLGITPCSYAYDNTSGTIFPYEIGPDNDQGNINNKFLISGALNFYTGTPVMTYYASTIPVSGTYRQGDYIVNSNVTAGGYMGWICTTAGTPGTWKGYGLIQA